MTASPRVGEAGLTLIENADVFGPKPLGIKSLLLGAGRVLWMGSEGLELPERLPLERVDLEGQRLVPGLIDGHAHVLGGGGESGYASSISMMTTEEIMAAGVTTVIGVLGTDDFVRTPAQLVYAVHGLRERGLSAWCYTGGYHVPPVTVTGSVRGDIIHIEAIIGLGEVAISDHRSSEPTQEELLRLASDAHVAGLMTGKAGILHLHLGDGERGLELVRKCLQESEIPARVFNPTHVNRRKALFDEALDLMPQGVWVDITAAPDDEMDEVPAFQAVERLLATELPAGHWTVSSDAGGSIPRFDAEGRTVEMGVGRSDVLLALLARLVRAGHALESILPGFTCNPATLLRLPGKGCIQTGADADLLVLDRDDVVLRSVWCRGVRCLPA